MPDISFISGSKLDYIDPNEVELNLIRHGLLEDVALRDTPRSDLTTHVYEGGFKVWECTIDLCQFIDLIPDAELEGKRVIELGCGAALPAILTAKKGAAYVVAQDFNKCVTDCFTSYNFRANNIPEENYALVSGSWEDLQGKVEPKSFDFVLTSETIYNEDDYAQLHDAFDLTLSENGKVWLAAKFFYFGVGGSVPGFLDFVNKAGKLKSEEKVTIADGVPRKVIELTRI